jgi:hypothetical protein
MCTNLNRDLLFVMGAPKTATTAVSGLLNSHPDVFVMCEVKLHESGMSRYGLKLIKGKRCLLPHFFLPFGIDKWGNYRSAHAALRAEGFAKRYFGDKLIGIDSNYASDFQDCRVIYTVRPLPEWLAKDSIRASFPLHVDLVPFAVQYTKHFIESFLLPRVHHVRMETFLERNAELVADIWRFLELDPPARAEAWWETIGHYPEEDPKRLLNWWKGHASSAVAPRENDTRIEIQPNPFWSDILPIFEKYYAGAGRSFARPEIEADLARLQHMIETHHQPFDTCYSAATSKSLNAHFKLNLKRMRQEKRRRNRFHRILKAVGLKH